MTSGPMIGASEHVIHGPERKQILHILDSFGFVHLEDGVAKPVCNDLLPPEG